MSQTFCFVFNSCRFQKSDIPVLVSALSLPPVYRCEQGTTATGIEALMILLRRLAYPNRLGDLVSIFGRSEPELSLIFNTVSFFSIICMCYNKLY